MYAENLFVYHSRTWKFSKSSPTYMHDLWRNLLHYILHKPEYGRAVGRDPFHLFGDCLLDVCTLLTKNLAPSYAVEKEQPVRFCHSVCFVQIFTDQTLPGPCALNAANHFPTQNLHIYKQERS